MVKIQYGLAGFFSGVFIGFLLTLVEMRFMEYSRHPSRMFALVAFTIIFCAISGIAVALKILQQKK